jgi:FliI/YscN family ATPase
MFMCDSLTRLAMAQRQIGLAAGEPPTSRGYTPSVFALLPRLLERCGPGAPRGSITAITTVLVEGDDMQDPVADSVRGIVDGHIVLSRRLASHGHFPPIDVLESLSRTMPMTVGTKQIQAAARIRDLLATYRENEELIRLAAYKKGSDPDVDVAIDFHRPIQTILRQDVEEHTPMEQTIRAIEDVARKSLEKKGRRAKS